jgi:hypothetical protein
MMEADSILYAKNGQFKNFKINNLLYGSSSKISFNTWTIQNISIASEEDYMINIDAYSTINIGNFTVGNVEMPFLKAE